MPGMKLSAYCAMATLQRCQRRSVRAKRLCDQTQFATMLAYASNADLSQYEGVTSFSDVSASAWYAPQVEWAYQRD